MRSYSTGVDATIKIGIVRQNKWHRIALERSRVHSERRWHLNESMAIPLSGNVKVTSRQPPNHLSQAFQSDDIVFTLRLRCSKFG